jgi:hypothetical protein
MHSLDTFWKKICMPLTQRTAQRLHTNQRELMEIKWTEGEANIDTAFSMVGCMCCQEAWNELKEEYPEYKDFSLRFEIPDINVMFLKDDKHIMCGKIELKSSKGIGLIPGSTIGNLDINQPIIFCLRNECERTFEIRYGQYHHCIGESKMDKFQDRTPRPFVNFHKMTTIHCPLEYIQKEKNDWIEHYAKCALFRTKSNELCKYKSWQDHLTSTIIKLFIKETSIEDFAKLKSME